MIMQAGADPWAALAGRLFATVPEAAAILCYDVRTVRRGIAAGEIPAVRVGATYRIRVAWLREQAGEVADDSPDQLFRTRPTTRTAAPVTGSSSLRCKIRSTPIRAERHPDDRDKTADEE